MSAEIRGITDYSQHWPKSAELYSLQTTARTHGSSPAEIDSELVSHRRLDISMVMVTGTRSYLQDFCRLLTQSLSYLHCSLSSWSGIWSRSAVLIWHDGACVSTRRPISSALSAQGCLRHVANAHDIWFQIVFVCRPVRMQPTTCRHSRDLYCFDF